MMNKTCVLIALVALLWISTFTFKVCNISFPELTDDARAWYVITRGKSSLPVVFRMNKALDSDVRVYGLWLEDMRYYADFQMVGSIYGYGSHLALNDVSLPECLRELDCDYLMVDGSKLPSTAPYMRDGRPIRIPTSAPWWDDEFELCEEFQVEGFEHIKVWELRDAKQQP